MALSPGDNVCWQRGGLPVRPIRTAWPGIAIQAGSLHFKTFVVEVSAFEFDLARCSFSLARQVLLLKSSVYN